MSPSGQAPSRTPGRGAEGAERLSTLWLLVVTLGWFGAGLIATRRLTDATAPSWAIYLFTGVGLLVGMAYAFYFWPIIRAQESATLVLQVLPIVILMPALVGLQIGRIYPRRKPRERLGLLVVLAWLWSLVASLLGFMLALTWCLVVQQVPA